jgi:hypothetical protein
VDRAIFDTNIYDKLIDDEQTCEAISKLIKNDLLRVEVPQTVEDELIESPHKGVPNLFPVKRTSDSVCILDHSKFDDARFGDGTIYEAHQGQSEKFKDAIIADTADSDCNIFVSEDNRCRKRLREFTDKCSCFSYAEFKEWLSEQTPN